MASKKQDEGDDGQREAEEEEEVEDHGGIRRHKRGSERMCRMRAALRDRGLTISGEGCRWWRRLIDATPAPLAASFSTASGGGRPLPPAFPLPFLLRLLRICIS